jgi:hypothetical protein
MTDAMIAAKGLDKESVERSRVRRAAQASDLRQEHAAGPALVGRSGVFEMSALDPPSYSMLMIWLSKAQAFAKAASANGP